MERARLVSSVRADGRDAVSFQALEPGLDYWETRGGIVAFAETSGGWVAVGGPLAGSAMRAKAASDFVDEAARRKKRASFFACDDVDELAAFSCLQLGEQPLYRPREWEATLRAHRRLREQLRRAKAKKVHVRRVDAAELEKGAALRTRLEDLANRWLASRPMEPMAFLVTLDLFEEPSLHRYYLAEREGEIVAFASLVPMGGDRGLLMEDVVRDRSAPNGTTELLFDKAMRDAAEDGAPIVTWGLAPLAGRVPWPMRLLGALGRGLYDFRGLRAFKARLHPSEWQPVFLVYPRGTAWPLHLVDALRAFAGGSLVLFGLKTVAHRPLVLAWLLTLALIPWTALLATLLVFHSAVPLFGFPRPELLAWVAFDALFATFLVRAFWRPKSWKYLLLAGAAAVDASLATIHLAQVGLGESIPATVIRIASMAAPWLATFGLLRCASYARLVTA